MPVIYSEQVLVRVSAALKPAEIQNAFPDLKVIDSNFVLRNERGLPMSSRTKV